MSEIDWGAVVVPFIHWFDRPRSLHFFFFSFFRSCEAFGAWDHPARSFFLTKAGLSLFFFS